MTSGRPVEYAVSPDPANTIRIPSAIERFGIAGPGLFLRSRLEAWYPLADMAASLTWACVPVIKGMHAGRRVAMNRNRAYIEMLTYRGVTVTGFDWLPSPNNWETGLESAIDFIADTGGRGFVRRGSRI